MALGRYSIMPLSGRMPDARPLSGQGAPPCREECPTPPPVPHAEARTCRLARAVPFEVELTASPLSRLADTGHEGSFARALRSSVTAAATPSRS
jgi:hypothetical protein